jgi:hypothetical protein
MCVEKAEEEEEEGFERISFLSSPESHTVLLF